MSPFLRTESLVSGYGRKRVVDSVTLEVDTGEFLGIVGPNGAGKSTFLKAMVGLLPVWEGAVFIKEEDIVNWSPVRRLREGLSLVPQGGRSFPDLTVNENLVLGGQQVLHKTQLKKRLTAMEERFPFLKPRGNHLASQLSGGERQQLALARALMARPKMLLLDEPSLGLSPFLVRQVFNDIGTLREEGVTAVIVEQNVEALVSIVNRLVIMREGRVVAETSPDGFLQDEGMVDLFMGRDVEVGGGA